MALRNLVVKKEGGLQGVRRPKGWQQVRKWEIEGKKARCKKK